MRLIAGSANICDPCKNKVHDGYSSWWWSPNEVLDTSTSEFVAREVVLHRVDDVVNCNAARMTRWRSRPLHTKTRLRCSLPRRRTAAPRRHSHQRNDSRRGAAPAPQRSSRCWDQPLPRVNLAPPFLRVIPWGSAPKPSVLRQPGQDDRDGRSLLKTEGPL